MGILDNGRPTNGRPVAVREELRPKPDQSYLTHLTAEEQEAIRAKAREKVLEERKKKAEDQYMQFALQEARREMEPSQEMCSILIDLAGHSDHITLDAGTQNGGTFHHGYTYEVTASVHATLMEIMARGWAHEEETGIPNHKFYKRPPYIGANYFDPGSRMPGVNPRIGNSNLGMSAESIIHGR